MLGRNRRTGTRPASRAWPRRPPPRAAGKGQSTWVAVPSQPPGNPAVPPAVSGVVPPRRAAVRPAIHPFGRQGHFREPCVAVHVRWCEREASLMTGNGNGRKKSRRRLVLAVIAGVVLLGVAGL